MTPATEAVVDTSFNEKAAFEMSRTRTWVMLNHAFFGSLVMNFRMEQNREIPTLGVGKDFIWYNPEYFLSLTDEERRFALAHEVMHPAFQHLFRRGQRDPFLWNYAGDIIINQTLDAEGCAWKRHPSWLFNPALYTAGNGTSEGVYEKLNDATRKGEKLKGVPQDECIESKEGTAADAAEAADMWKIYVGQAATQARMAGKLSANMERFVGQALKSKVDWRAVLREFLTHHIKMDRTFARPNRRFAAMGMVMPSDDIHPAMNELVLAFDMSGSIGPEQAEQFYGEALAICNDVRPTKLHGLYFDSRVCGGIDSFDSPEDFEFKPRGGGGTAFSPIFAAIHKSGIEVACCVVLTDLYCSDFGEEPPYPVLWVSTGDDKAPWGRVVKMEGDK